MFQVQKSKLFWIIVVCVILAGVSYNSWPLGYWLNPTISQRGLASELGAFGQPYNWLFVWLDVFSGGLVLAASVLLWRRSTDTLQRIVLVNFGLFGLMTAISALVPMTCEPSIHICPSITSQPWLIVHGIASIAASVSLFVSVCLVWWQKRHKRGAIIMSTLLAGWTAFGILSVYFFFVPGPGYLVQHYYITLCSVWLILLPFMFDIKFVMPRRKYARAR